MKENINSLNNNMVQGAETAQKDPFDFPVPGHSLTDEPEKWNWDKPPQTVDPDKAVAKVIERIEKPETKEHFLRLMAGGVSVEEIVNTIGLGGFTEGEWSPDVAEIIKPPLAVYFIALAIKNKVPVIAFSKEELKEESSMVSKGDTFKLMKERNPEEFEKVKSTMLASKGTLQEEQPSEGFIDMKAGEVA